MPKDAAITVYMPIGFNHSDNRTNTTEFEDLKTAENPGILESNKKKLLTKCSSCSYYFSSYGLTHHHLVKHF